MAEGTERLDHDGMEANNRYVSIHLTGTSALSYGHIWMDGSGKSGKPYLSEYLLKQMIYRNCIIIIVMKGVILCGTGY